MLLNLNKIETHEDEMQLMFQRLCLFAAFDLWSYETEHLNVFPDATFFLVITKVQKLFDRYYASGKTQFY